jgi:hypothetical protein
MKPEMRRELLRSSFLEKLVAEAKERDVICGNLTTDWTVRKNVAKGIKMIYVIRMNSARVEMWIWHGKEEKDVDSARDVFDYFLSKKSEIETAYGRPLNWDYPRPTAFSIQQDYADFRLSDQSKWDYWIDLMVEDMEQLDTALLPHYLSSRK